MSVAIKIEGVSKIYRLGEIGTGTVSHDLERWFKMKILGKEDPFLKIGETNNRAKKGESNIVYSLHDINLEINQGDAVGVIGRNGAGKSTLLKILSRVTSPSTGSIKIKGRVASLLEVGTGFHPELTGLENIYLNGAILGMRKKEITRKLDEIVDFSGVERYLETPVKRYSSGMYVRLAFAVAAHLESEILIVDEVLAVGDAEFQKKCIGKMDDISKGQGRTILFVSHNMNSIQNLCKKGILLSHGEIACTGSVNDVINQYSAQSTENLSSSYRVHNLYENKGVQLMEAIVQDARQQEAEFFDISDDIFIKTKIFCKENVPSLFGYITVKNIYGEVMIESDTHDFPPNPLEELITGNNEFILNIKAFSLPQGEYIVDFCLAVDFGPKPHIDNAGEILRFYVSDTFTRRGNKRAAKTGTLIGWTRLDTENLM